MLNVFFSTASRKAWAGGVLTTLLSPLVTLVNSGPEGFTWKALAFALVSGVLSAAGVYAVTNKPPGEITEVDLAEAEGDVLAEHEEAIEEVPPHAPYTQEIDYNRPPLPPLPYDDEPGEHSADR